MKFTLAKTPRYWWPVTVRVPDPDNAGKMLEQQLRLWVEPMTRDEQVAANEELNALTTMREMTDFDVAQTLRVVKGWEGVVDDDGAPVPFSEDALKQAMQFDWFRRDVAAAVTASLRGEEARLGN